MVEVLGHDEPIPGDAEPMGAPHRLRFRISVEGRAREVFALLSTPSELPRLHPLIRGVEQTLLRKSGTVLCTDFSVEEDIPLLGGRFSVHNRYRGRVTVDAAQPLVTRLSGWSVPGVRIEARHRLSAADELEETLWFSAPLIVRSLVRRQLLHSHAKTLEAAVAVACGRPLPR